MADYMEKFIIEAGKVKFSTDDGRKWQMRQPTPDEAAAGDSAYRIAYDSVMNDDRLRDLAKGAMALKKEAGIRGSAAEAVYMLPLLLERQRGENWRPAFDVHDAEDMARFERLSPGVVVEMTRIYWGPVQQAIREAKKKSQ